VQVREASCNSSFREFSTSEAVTSGENRETKRDFLRTLFYTTEREEELLTPIMGTLGVFVVLATTAVFTGDGLILFFLTTVTKSPSEEFSPVTMYESGTRFLAGAATVVAPGLPTAAQTISLYDLAAELFAMADETASRIIGTCEGAYCMLRNCIFRASLSILSCAPRC
jgi:hypothetical protein